MHYAIKKLKLEFYLAIKRAHPYWCSFLFQLFYHVTLEAYCYWRRLALAYWEDDQNQNILHFHDLQATLFERLGAPIHLIVPYYTGFACYGEWTSL